MLFDLPTYTLIHVMLSLVGILSGLVVVGGLMAGVRFDRWTALFLATTALTNITGFGFPFNTLLPSHIVGGLSLVILPVAIAARYWKHLAGGWRKVFVVTAVAALYFNVFVLLAQLLQKIPLLSILAPNPKAPDRRERFPDRARRDRQVNRPRFRAREHLSRFCFSWRRSLHLPIARVTWSPFARSFPKNRLPPSRAAALGDLRFLGVAGYAVTVPGVDSPKCTVHRDRVRIVEGTSDMPCATEGVKLQAKATSFAQRYNAVIRAQLHAQEVRSATADRAFASG